MPCHCGYLCIKKKTTLLTPNDWGNWQLVIFYSAFDHFNVKRRYIKWIIILYFLHTFTKQNKEIFDKSAGNFCEMVHSPLFFSKIIEIERFALRAAILDER